MSDVSGDCNLPVEYKDYFIRNTDSDDVSDWAYYFQHKDYQDNDDRDYRFGHAADMESAKQMIDFRILLAKRKLQ